MIPIAKPYKYIPDIGDNKEKDNGEQAYFMLMPFAAPTLISFQELQKASSEGDAEASQRILDTVRQQTMEVYGFSKFIYNKETKETEEVEIESVDDFFANITIDMMGIVCQGLTNPVDETELGNS